MRNVLFICSQNRLRSPTAEQVFSTRADLSVFSAGLNHDAESPHDSENVISPEPLEWADMIFVMEKTHRNKLSAKFGKYLCSQKVIRLDIPDIYDYMDPALIRLLEIKVARHLPLS